MKTDSNKTSEEAQVRPNWNSQIYFLFLRRITAVNAGVDEVNSADHSGTHSKRESFTLQRM